MDHQRPQWADKMSGPPFSRSHFTPELSNRILQKANRKKLNRRRLVWPAIVITAVVVTVWVGLTGAGGWKTDVPSSKQSEPLPDIKFQNEYYKDGKLIFSVFPDPDLEAGKEIGYNFHFTAPFGQFQNRLLSIYAVHVASGYKVTVQKPVRITKPSSGYPGLQRFTVLAGLPISGKWRYVVELDGEEYGTVMLNLIEPSWELAPQFTSGNYRMTGFEDKIGFIDPGFIAGKKNKYMWHLWGLQEELQGTFEVKAVKEGDTQIVDVFKAGSLGGKNNGADAHLPVEMSLPEPGRWRLLPYLGDRMLASIVVDVKQAREE